MKEKFNATGKPSYFVLGYDAENSTSDTIVLKELQPGTNFEQGYDVDFFHAFLKGGINAYQKMAK